MGARPAVGEVLLAAAFGAIGVFWMVTAASLPLWEGFAPGGGFLPLVYGGLLTVLAAAAIVVPLMSKRAESESAREPLGKPARVAGALLFGAIAVEPIGFVAAMFLMLFFLYAVVEHLSIPLALTVSAVTVAVLSVVFRTWLGVPLPLGPGGL